MQSLQCVCRSRVLRYNTFGDGRIKSIDIEAMATQLGRIEEFRDEKEDWDHRQYAERLKHFFAANGIAEAEKKRSVFLTVIGAKAYNNYEV